MISFKKMWDDVKEILNGEESIGIDIMEKFNSGFTVRENETTTFVTRDDFVDFWCNMLYHNQVSAEQVINEDLSKQKYIYEIIKKLPYIDENSGILKIIE